MGCAPVRRDNPRALSSVDLAQYGESLAKDWVSVECGTSTTSILVLSVRKIFRQDID